MRVLVIPRNVYKNNPIFWNLDTKMIPEKFHNVIYFKQSQNIHELYL